MISIVLALMLWQQGAATAPRPQSGLITGQVRTSDNSFAAGVRVAALSVPEGNMRPEDGPNYFNAGPPGSTGLTDAQGRFRLENVPPGRYYIMAGLAADPTYYPDAGAKNQKNATVLTITGGQTVENINIKLLGTTGYRVNGRLNLIDGLKAQQTVTLTGAVVEEFLTVPVQKDGTFEFGRVPPGLYMLTTLPLPPGLAPFAVSVRTGDVTGVVLTSPPTHTVSGKIVMQNNGPIPVGLLSFYNNQTFIGATVNPDGTFSAKLHAARHQVDVAGMPVGYELASVKLGTADASKGFTVANADVSGIVVTVSAPKVLPRVRGTVTGLPAARLAETKVELTGPIFGALQATIRPDGTFDFPIMVPGLYRVRLLQVPEFSPVELVVTDQPLTTTALAVRAR